MTFQYKSPSDIFLKFQRDLLIIYITVLYNFFNSLFYSFVFWHISTLFRWIIFCNTSFLSSWFIFKNTVFFRKGIFNYYRDFRSVKNRLWCTLSYKTFRCRYVCRILIQKRNITQGIPLLILQLNCGCAAKTMSDKYIFIMSKRDGGRETSESESLSIRKAPSHKAVCFLKSRNVNVLPHPVQFTFINTGSDLFSMGLVERFFLIGLIYTVDWQPMFAFSSFTDQSLQLITS